MIKILIIGSVPPVRRLLQMRIELENDLLVIGETEIDQLTLERVLQLKPDVILLMADSLVMDGVVLSRQLKLGQERIPVILLSLETNLTALRQAQEIGAAGVVSMQASTSRLAEALRCAVQPGPCRA